MFPRKFSFARRSCLLAAVSILASATFIPMLPREAAADDVTHGTLTVQHPWSRATPGAAKVGAMYLTVRNSGAEDDRLLGVTTAINEKSELHLSEMTGDVMNMRQVDEVTVPAGGSAEFAPQGAHIMLVGLQKPLKKGERFKATLHFANAGDIEIEVKVQGIADMAPAE